MTTILTARKVTKRFGGLVAVDGLDVDIPEHSIYGIIGPNGAGKTTFFNCITGFYKPDEGEIHFEGRRIDDLAASARDVLRNQYLGMIFQFYHLLPELSTIENVLVPRMIAEGTLKYLRNRRQHRQQAEYLLELVGLAHRLKHKPNELSGGEMQRAAIARALIAGPQVLLADEPTGNLDNKSGEEIMEILRTLNADQNLTIVMVTHDTQVAAQADRIVRLVEGRVEAA